MTQEIFILNAFFSYFFNLGDYLEVFLGLGLAGALLLGFLKYFTRDSA